MNTPGHIVSCPHCGSTEGSYTFKQYTRAVHLIEGQYGANGDTEYIDDAAPEKFRNGSIAKCTVCNKTFRIQGEKKFVTAEAMEE